MGILVVNAGSTSVKFKYFNDDYSVPISGQLDDKANGSAVKLKKDGQTFEWKITDDEFADSPRLILKELKGLKIDKIGFRVVHGGETYIKPTKLDERVVADLTKLNKFAPLHNPPALAAVKKFTKLLPEVPKYAVFDTAFHATLPEKAYRYAIPAEYYDKHKIRRYGFHGTSHKYVSERFAKLEPASSRIISCHLGGGASITAIRDGISIDTSMGFTPLEGLTMATRSGDIDPGVIFFLGDELGMGPHEINELLNKKSGLLGLSGETSDMKKLLELEKTGNKLAALAISVYVYRIQKYIGAYASALSGLDGLIFTAGVGQGSDVIRKRICSPLSYLYIYVEDEINDGKFNVSYDLKISSETSIPVWVIPTDEEFMIAREIEMLN